MSSSRSASLALMSPASSPSACDSASARPRRVASSSDDLAEMPRAISRPPSLSVLAASTVLRARLSLIDCARAASTPSMRSRIFSNAARTSSSLSVERASAASMPESKLAAASWLRLASRWSSSPPRTTTVCSIAASVASSWVVSSFVSASTRATTSRPRSVSAVSMLTTPSRSESSTVRVWVDSASSTIVWLAAADNSNSASRAALASSSRWR